MATEIGGIVHIAGTGQILGGILVGAGVMQVLAGAGVMVLATIHTGVHRIMAMDMLTTLIGMEEITATLMEEEV